MIPNTQNLAKPIFIVLIAFTIFWHFWSLTYSPLPWFDETFFASITHSLINGKGMHLAVCPIQTNGDPVLIYGPVYFIITGLITKTLGFSLYTFRLANLLGAIISVFLFFKITKKQGWKKTTMYLMTILLTFDVIFVQNAHSGRMDLAALAFLLGSIYLYFFDKTSISRQVFIAILGTLAVLTTLRIAVLVLPFFVLVLFINIKNKQYWQAAALLFTSILLYASWIGVGFGSLSGFIAEYTQSQSDSYTGQTLVSSFLGGNFAIQPYQYPMVVAGLLAVIIQIKHNYKNPTFWLISIPILCFYLLVNDTGAYSALVVPFWYLLIGFAFEKLSTNSNNSLTRLISLCVIILLLLVNGGVFLLKSATILTTIPQRSNKQLTTWVSERLPAQSRVVGDDRYYYAVIESNSDFQYISRTQSDEERAKFHKETYQPDYLFISSQTPPELIEAYKKHFRFEESYSYIPQTQESFLTRIIQRLPMQIQTSMAGNLIKVESKADEN